MPAFIQGFAASVTWADGRQGLDDLIFNTVTAALADAGRAMDEVETIVLAAHDLIDGRSLSSMVTAPAAGAYLRDEIRLAEDGLVAASLAAAQVESGQSPLAVVAAWGRASEVDFVSQARAAFDPGYVQPFGLTESGISAMRLSAWISKYGPAREDRHRAAAARLARAQANPRALFDGPIWPIPAYPLQESELPRLADVAVAAIVGAAPTRVRIAGVGNGTDRSDAGTRDLLGLPSLRTAAAAALADAGRELHDMGAVELDGFTLIDEVLGMEALGLAAPGTGFAQYAEHPTFNASGAAAAGWCYPAMGLMRLHEIYRALTAPGSTKRHGLAIGASPVGAQAHSAMVLEAS